MTDYNRRLVMILAPSLAAIGVVNVIATDGNVGFLQVMTFAAAIGLVVWLWLSRGDEG